MINQRRPAALAFISYLPWWALFVWISSVAWFLCDDAFISFRYVRNLLEGHGLVFNPGEYVEGYTNFLWILELAAIWAVAGVPPEQAAPWLSVGYTIGTVAVVLWWAARLPSQHNRGLVGWMALGLLCSSATFAVWTSAGGLETRQFTFFVVLAVVCLYLYRDGRGLLVTASLSLAAAELTRPEGLMLAGLCFAWFAYRDFFKERSITVSLLRKLLCLLAPFAFVVAAHYLSRYAYYGEWLPNTYYAKHVRPWYDSGFRYLSAAALETGLYLLLPLAFLALYSRWQIYRDPSFSLPLLCVCVHMAYLVPIGGDHFEYRPLDFYWPLLSIPASQGIADLGANLAGAARRFARQFKAFVTTEAFTIVLFLPILFYANSIQSALLFEGLEVREPVFMHHFELGQENASWLLKAPGMPALVSMSNDLRSQLTKQLVGTRAAEHREFVVYNYAAWKPYEKIERGAIPENAVMSGGDIGRFYYLPDLTVIDENGLTDATVARMPVLHPNSERIIAHDRETAPEYLQQRGVNIGILAAEDNESDANNRGAMFAIKMGPNLWMPAMTDDPALALELHARERQSVPVRPHEVQVQLKRAVHYDRDISLIDLAFERNDLLWMKTRWQTAPGLENDLKTSLRLYNEEGKRVWAHDYFLFTLSVKPTSVWEPNIPINILSQVDIPPDIPPGEYELRLVVYDGHTLIPTVELGVWQGETVLAQLQIQ